MYFVLRSHGLWFVDKNITSHYSTTIRPVRPTSPAWVAGSLQLPSVRGPLKITVVSTYVYTGILCVMCISQKVTHPKSLNHQVSGLQLTLHNAQEGQELWLAQVVHVQLTFLKHTDTEMWARWQEISSASFGQMLRFLMVRC